MRGALGYRLLTSGGPLAAVSLLVVDVAVGLETRESWRGDGLWAVQQFGSSLDIALPVLLVLCSLPPLLRGGVTTDEAMLPSRLLRSRLLRFALDVAPLLIVHLGFVGAALIYARVHGDVLHWPSTGVSVFAQVLAIVFVCALGRGIGEVGRHPAAVLAAALVGVMLAGFGANALRVSAGSSPYAGLAVEPAGYLAAAVVLVVASGLVLSRQRGRLVGGAAVTASAMLVLAAGQGLAEPSLRASGATPADCERIGDVSVCVFSGYDFMKTDLAARTRASLTAFDEHGVDPHLEKVAQSIPGVVEQPGVVSVGFDVGSLAAGALGPGMVRASLLQPGWCPRINSPQVLPARFDREQLEAYAWLAHAEGASDDQGFERSAPGLARLPESEQAAMVQGFLDRNLSCEGLR